MTPRTERTPQFRHATSLAPAWIERLWNPRLWTVGNWSLNLAILTACANMFVLGYLFNVFGTDMKTETMLWLLVAGLTGFAAISLGLWAIVGNLGRSFGAWGFGIGMVFGALPAWLVGNTILQFFLNGFTLPSTPPSW